MKQFSGIIRILGVSLIVIFVLMHLGTYSVSKAATILSPTPSPSLSPSPTPPGMRVQGNQFMKDGTVFHPRGFNMIGVLTPPGCTNNTGVTARNHFGQAEMDAAKNWKANTLRMQVSQSGLSTSNTTNLANYLTQIQNSVALARNNGFTVILSMQDQSIGCGKAHPLPSDQTTKAWTKLAPLFVSNPYVMFELFNEPQNAATSTGWAQWLNGGNTPMTNTGTDGSVQNVVGHQSLVNTIRSLGANNVLLSDGGAMAEKLQGIPMLKDTASARGIAYAVHPYYYTMANTPQAWYDRYAYLTATVPVLATEWNYTSADCGTVKETTAPTFLNYLLSKNIGVLGHSLDTMGILMADWTWSPTSCSSATSPGAGVVLKNYFNTLSTKPGY